MPRDGRLISFDLNRASLELDDMDPAIDSITFIRDDGSARLLINRQSPARERHLSRSPHVEEPRPTYTSTSSA